MFDYAKALTQLEKLLRRKPMTARALAKKLGCSKPALYKRLRALEAEHPLTKRKVRESTTGPSAWLYSLS